MILAPAPPKPASPTSPIPTVSGWSCSIFFPALFRGKPWRIGRSRVEKVASPSTVAAFRMRRFHSNDRHHAAVLVSENMAMVDEIADQRAAEIHPHFNARVRPRARPIRYLNRVEILPVAHRNAVLFQRQEMNLMNVEFVILQ